MYRWSARAAKSHGRKVSSRAVGQTERHKKEICNDLGVILLYWWTRQHKQAPRVELSLSLYRWKWTFLIFEGEEGRTSKDGDREDHRCRTPFLGRCPGKRPPTSPPIMWSRTTSLLTCRIQAIKNVTCLAPLAKDSTYFFRVLLLVSSTCVGISHSS